MRHLPLEHPGIADHRNPTRFLWWLIMGQRHTMLAGMAFGIVWMVVQAVMPAIIGRAIDEGIAAKRLFSLDRRDAGDRPRTAAAGSPGGGRGRADH